LIYDQKAAYHRLDISDAGAVDLLISDFQPEAVINCAAYTNVDGAETERDSACGSTAKAPDIRRRLPNINSRIVHISTD
jgi:dTDP-4-dehydrorhamnose reductase